MLNDAMDWFYGTEGLSFGHAEAEVISELPGKTIQNWCDRGLLRDMTGDGKGNKRKYGASHLSIMVYARDLINLGFETNLAVSIGMAVHIEMLKVYRDLLKGGKVGHEMDEAFAFKVALINPDRQRLKHRVAIGDFRNINIESFRPDKAVIFYPSGFAIARAVTAALTEKKRQGVANRAGAAMEGAHA